MDRRSLLVLAGILALAGGLRLAAFEAARPLQLVGDEAYYAQVANHIARGRGHLYVGGMEGPSRAWRPPGHAWLLSRAVDTRAPEPAEPTQSQPLLRRLAGLQLALGTLLVLLTALLGRVLFEPRTGLVAALLAALSPALVVHSHYLWSETLFAVLVTAGLVGIAALQPGPRPAWAALLGVVFGLAALTREVALLVACVGAGWWAWMAPRHERRRVVVAAALMIGVALLVVAPWTLRNHRLLQRVVPVSTIGWFALAEGNALESPRWMARSGPVQAAFHRDYFSTRNEVERLDLARHRGLEQIRAEQPAWLFKKTLRNLALLLNPDSVLRLKIRRGAYGDVSPPLIRALLAASIPVYLGLLTAAVLGIAAAAAAGRRALAVGLLAAVALLHIVSVGTPRFRVPWLPLLAVYAGHALLSPSSLRRLGRAPALAAAAFLLFLFAVCVPYFAIFGGRP